MSSDVIQLKRVYDGAEPGDGLRVLCTTRWPRGVKKESIDQWRPELGTPKELIRPWLDGQMEYEAFRQGVQSSLQSPEAQQALEELAAVVREGRRITLLTSVKDVRDTHLSIVVEALREKL